jgi:uncharacterized protein with PIN domain
LQQQRIILTRDRGILKYGSVTHGYWVRDDNPNQQLTEVVNRLQLINNIRPFTRCSKCNGLLHSIDKVLLAAVLPSHVYQSFNRFLECKGCSKIYWRGSHYHRISKWINNLKN